MNFLAPAWLAIAGLALYVLVLHMRRRRALDVPSVMLWRLMENTAAPSRRLRWPPPSILLLLQLLVIALVALALAQPLLGSGRTDSSHTIYVIDTSASMRATDEAPTRFDAARAFLEAGIRNGGATADHRISVVVAGPAPQVLVARQPDAERASMLDAVAPLRATDASANWAITAEVIAPLVEPTERPVIVLLTDGADAGEAAIAAAFPDATIERAVFASEAPANLGLTATAIQGMSPDDTPTWQVTGNVLFPAGAPDEVKVTVLFQPAGTNAFVPLGEANVQRPVAPPVIPAPAPAEPAADPAAAPVEPAATALPAVEAPPVDVKPFIIDLPIQGAGQILVQLPDDAAAYDNTVRLLVQTTPVTARIVYVGDPSTPLVAALQAIQNIELVAATDVPNDDETYDLVIVDDAVVSRRPSTNVLWIGNARVLGSGEPVILESPTLTGWDADHELSDLVDWTAVQATRAYRFPRLAGAKVLAETGGVSLVQARTTPTGREIQVAFDIDSSGWPRGAGFPVFVRNVVDWLGTNVGAIVLPPCTAGVPCTIEPRLIGGEVLDDTGASVWSARIEGVDYLLPGVENTFVPSTAGFYSLVDGDVTRTIAVNAVATETAIAPLAANAATLTDSGSTLALWRWLLVAALLVLLAETWMAGRGQEQFLKGTALSRSNPLHVRRRLQLGFRIAAIVFLVGAVAGLPWLGREPAEDTIVVVGNDLGGDVPNAERDRLVAEVQRDLGAGARGGLITTGDTNRIAADIGGMAAGEAITETPGTNLEQAMLLAAAMVPGDRDARVVLATDGNETEGDLAATLQALQARGIRVDIQPITELPVGEVLVESVTAPARVFAGDTFKLDAVIYSQAAKTGAITVRRAGETIIETPVELLAGRNVIEIPGVPAGNDGDLLVEVSITAEGDTYAQNNANGVIIGVTPSPSILIVTPQPPLGDYFAQALSVQGLTAEIVLPADAPDTIDGWLAYDTVVMMNVPAIDFDTAQQEELEDYVSIHGRGLLILGGENTFGPGGYYETPFERVSPLSSRVPHELPAVSIVYVLDRSGSMSAAVDETNTTTRLDVAKSATMSAASLLGPASQVGVVLFDSSSYVLLPLQERLDLAALQSALEPVVPGGGTNIYPGLEQALNMLSGVDSAAKHILIMTDGITAGADFTGLMNIARDRGITVSTIGIGGGADDRRLEEIARLGGGQFHLTPDVRALPSIMAQESLMLAGSPFKEEIAPVAWADRSEDFLAGLPDQMPPVYAYVVTTAKPQADVHMTVTGEDGTVNPLLASWRYGNGQVVALATHGAGAGTAEWIQLPEYPLLWSQIIRHVLPDTGGPGLNVNLDRTGDTVRVVADLLDPEGVALTGQAVTATVTIADVAQAPITLREVADGRYEGTFTVGDPGAYQVEVAAGDVTGGAAMYVAYPARYNFGRADFDKLRALAAATGGELLLGDEPVFTTETRWVAKPAWQLWTVIAILLVMADLTVRHAPNLFGLRRRRAKPLGPALAVPA
ncbi:MAG: VWA domain-containing protein [Bauldia sp.]|nr:VWA domain-containing protein [Bauldia sp.]